MSGVAGGGEGNTSQTTGLYGKPIRAKSDSHIVIVSSDPVANHGL
jgi:hypothetical protein